MKTDDRQKDKCVCPVFLSAVIFVIVIVATWLSQWTAYEFRIHSPEKHPLFDIGHWLISFEPRTWIPDVITGGVLLITIILLSIHKQAATLWRDTFLHLSLVLFIRCFTIVMTTLPDPSPGCRGENPLGANPLSWIVRFRSCGDLIFSGHTTFLLTCAVMLWRAYPIERVWHFGVQIIAVTGVALGVVYIIACRIHYTVDVVTALVVNTIVFLMEFSFAHQLIGVRRARGVLEWCAADDCVCARCPCECCAGCENRCCEGCSGCDGLCKTWRIES